MTCARREAGAHRPAASIPSRSPSSGPTPPGDRSRPDPRGGRARLALLLPALALLLGALSLFAAAPAHAQIRRLVCHADGEFVKRQRMKFTAAVISMDGNVDRLFGSALTDNDDFTYSGAHHIYRLRLFVLAVKEATDLIVFSVDEESDDECSRPTPPSTG